MSESELPHPLLLTATISSSVSLLGSTLILTLYLVSKKARENYFFFWVLHLSLVDFLLSWGSLYNWETAFYTECIVFAVMTGCGITGSYAFITYIAWHLYEALTRDDIVESKIYQNRLKLVVYTYIVILILVFGPLITSSYGNGAEFCWLKTSLDTATFVWTMIEYYIPIIVCIPLVSVLYFKIYKKLPNDDYHTKPFHVLLWIPALYIATNCFAVADRIIVYMGGDYIVVKYGHTLFRQLQGCYHAIIYGYSYLKYAIVEESILSNKRSNKLKNESSSIHMSLLEREID